MVAPFVVTAATFVVTAATLVVPGFAARAAVVVAMAVVGATGRGFGAGELVHEHAALALLELEAHALERVLLTCRLVVVAAPDDAREEDRSARSGQRS
jgi:hypothetical protein